MRASGLAPTSPHCNCGIMCWKSLRTARLTEPNQREGFEGTLHSLWQLRLIHFPLFALALILLCVRLHELLHLLFGMPDRDLDATLTTNGWSGCRWRRLQGGIVTLEEIACFWPFRRRKFVDFPTYTFPVIVRAEKIRADKT
jgi:hypothetical protein